jgi:hypothetical protein
MRDLTLTEDLIASHGAVHLGGHRLTSTAVAPASTANQASKTRTRRHRP